eukprot:33851_4
MKAGSFLVVKAGQKRVDLKRAGTDGLCELIAGKSGQCLSRKRVAMTEAMQIGISLEILAKWSRSPLAPDTASKRRSENSWILSSTSLVIERETVVSAHTRTKSFPMRPMRQSDICEGGFFFVFF